MERCFQGPFYSYIVYLLYCLRYEGKKDKRRDASPKGRLPLLSERGSAYLGNGKRTIRYRPFAFSKSALPEGRRLLYYPKFIMQVFWNFFWRRWKIFRSQSESRKQKICPLETSEGWGKKFARRRKKTFQKI